jgi:hypothetical protein
MLKALFCCATPAKREDEEILLALKAAVKGRLRASLNILQ